MYPEHLRICVHFRVGVAMRISPLKWYRLSKSVPVSTQSEHCSLGDRRSHYLTLPSSHLPAYYCVMWNSSAMGFSRAILLNVVRVFVSCQLLHIFLCSLCLYLLCLFALSSGNDADSLADDRIYWFPYGGDLRSSKRDGTDTKKETTGQKVTGFGLRGADYIIASGYVVWQSTVNF